MAKNKFIPLPEKKKTEEEEPSQYAETKEQVEARRSKGLLKTKYDGYLDDSLKSRQAESLRKLEEMKN